MAMPSLSKSSTKTSTAPLFLTSNSIARTLMSWASHRCSAVSESLSIRLAARIRLAPASAKALALAAPMPEEAPVIRTVVSLSFMVSPV